jgi:CHAD domain-containing protein
LPYRFKADDASVTKGLRRIAVEQIDRALGEIDDPGLDRHAVVHQVRKRCKKLRGLARLVRPAFPAYSAENAAFRDAAGSLSFVRDTEALIDTYDDLIDRYAEPIDTQALATVRHRLEERQREIAAAHDLEGKLAAFRTAMTDARGRAQDWQLDADGFAAIAGGLKKTHKRARNAMARATADGTAAAFHEWRKRTKYHWYHTRLLRPVWPGPLEAHADAADTLGDALGDHHDLAVLQAAIAADPNAYGEPATTDVLHGLITARQATLEAEALTLGARLFAEPTKVLVKRWGRYWAVWRDEARDT